MSGPLRFLVDENLPAVIAEVLEQDGHDVLDIAGSSFRGKPDSEVWQLAIDEDRLLVTRDLDFPLGGSSGRPPGIILLRPGPTMRTQEIADILARGMSATDPSQLVGQITVIEPSRVRQRSYSNLPE